MTERADAEGTETVSENLSEYDFGQISELQTESISSPEITTEIQSEKTPAEKKSEILANRSLYPDKILDMLDKNAETLDFVYDYPEKENQVFADHLDKTAADSEIPLLIQWDERWGYGKYGQYCVGTNGCGPTCMAMVIAGLTGNYEITPYEMAVYSEEHGYLTDDGNTLWSFIADGGEAFGVTGQTIPLTEESVIQTLKQQIPIICSMRPGDFTDSGHFIVLTGYIDGKIKVNDPYSYANSERLWDFEVLKPQIKNLWQMLVMEKTNETEIPG